MVTKGTYIVDLKGLGMKHLNSETRNFLKDFTKIMSDNYPECVEKMFILNAPFFFTAIWKFIGPLIDKRTRDKISVLGGQKEYLPKVLEWVPKENLPDFFGGTDTTCDFKTEKGPWAEHYPVGCTFRED